MRRRAIRIILLAVLAVLLVAGSALAMLSDNHRLGWLAEGSAGGGRMDSAGYSANVTVGQVVVGESQSPNYQSWPGFWQGMWRSILLFLPVLVENPQISARAGCLCELFATRLASS